MRAIVVVAGVSPGTKIEFYRLSSSIGSKGYSPGLSCR